MEEILFNDFDDEVHHDSSLAHALNPSALNFIVEFGGERAHIRFDVDDSGFRWLLNQDSTTRVERPVRWINLWTPYRQRETVRLLAEHYKFSARLSAILRTPPPPSPAETSTPENGAPRLSFHHDTEKANGRVSIQLKDVQTPAAEANHYTIASHLTNYQSVDVGEKFLCIGANWMHHISDNVEKRLWSWLVVCDDGTVISMHEGLGIEDPDESMMLTIRSHTREILSQLTKPGIVPKGRSVGLVSIRQTLPDQTSGNAEAIGNEGASNLFYYLFDDWQNSYRLIIAMKRRLEKLSDIILSGAGRKYSQQDGGDIIKELYVIGRELRTNQHMHEGYSSIIKRILEYKQVSSPSATFASHPTTPNASFHFQPAQFLPSPPRRITLALSASERFERLGDRIHLLVLSSLNEALSEKDALLSTYFNITAQLDSISTTKLTKNAAILSKLGVLFLPVSLMTAYFSVQIDDLQGVYTARTYWVAFAVIMSVSVACLFFFQFWLVRVMEMVEGLAVTTPGAFTSIFGRSKRRRHGLAE